MIDDALRFVCAWYGVRATLLGIPTRKCMIVTMHENKSRPIDMFGYMIERACEVKRGQKLYPNLLIKKKRIAQLINGKLG